MYMKIILTRHAQRDDMINFEKYEGNINNNCPISKRGSDITDKIWKDYFYNNNNIIEKIYVSPFLRTQQTAEIIKNNYKLFNNNNPKIEINYNFAEGQHLYPPNFNNELKKKLKENNINFKESLEDIKKRIKNGLHTIINNNNENSTIIIVSHGVICGSVVEILLKNHFFYDNIEKDNIIFSVGDYCVFEFKKNINEWEIIDSLFQK